MNEKSKADAPLTTGDWIMAGLCFVLPLLLPIVLAIYNFAKRRKSRGVLYIGTFALQIVLGGLLMVGGR